MRWVWTESSWEETTMGSGLVQRSSEDRLTESTENLVEDQNYGEGKV